MVSSRTRVGRFGRAPVLAACAAALAAAAPALAETVVSPSPPPADSFEIQAYDVDGNTILDQLAVETAVYPHLGPARTRADVDAAREALEQAYHERGYQSVVVEIPAQTVGEGVVRLHVVEVPVGRLRVVGSRYHSLDRIKALAPSLREGQVPDLTAAQGELTELNRTPDRRVTPLLKPGKTPGTIDIDLKVKDAEPLHASVELSNDHSANTEPLRLTATLRYDNLWQLGHTISATYLVSPQDRSNVEVFAGSYLAPLWGTPWSVLAYGYTSNSAVATLGGADVLGKGYTIGLRGILQLPQHGDITQSINFGIDFKHWLEAVGVAGPSSEAAIDYWPLNAVYSLQRSAEASTTDLTVGVTLGLRGLGTDPAGIQNKRLNAKADFIHLNVDFDHSRNLWLGMVGAAKLSAQFADQPLVSSEQFSAGGWTSVRGYLQSEAIGDEGVAGSLEVRSPSFASRLGSLVDEWRVFAFADGAYVWVLDPLAEQRTDFALYSAGLGTRFQVWRHIHGDVALSVPLTAGVTTKAYRPFAAFSLKTDF